MSIPPPSYEPAPPLGPEPPPNVPSWSQRAAYQPLDGRLRLLKVVLLAIAALSVIAAVFDVLEIRLMNQVIGGKDVSDAAFDASDARQAAIGWLQTVGVVAGAIAFILWMHRAYQNTDVVAPGTRRYGHGWAIGGWFVPILNLWRPKQVANDIAHAGGRSDDPSGKLALWWTLWLVSSLLANAARQMTNGAQTPEAYRSGAIAYLVSDGLTVVAAFVAISVAATLTYRLNRRAAEDLGGAGRLAA